MYINKWQRLVLSLGAIVCFVRAFYIWQDDHSDSRPGTAFLAGVTLAVLALIRPREGESVLPFLDILAVRKRQIINGVAVVAVLAMIGLTIIGVAIVALEPEANYAAADKVEMPSEGAFPAGSSTAQPQSHLEQVIREDKQRQDVLNAIALRERDERERAASRVSRPAAEASVSDDPYVEIYQAQRRRSLKRMEAERARRDSYEGLSPLERAADAAEAAADEAQAEASALTTPNKKQP